MEKVITKKEVQAKLSEALFCAIATEGFILKKKDYRIIRNTKFGFESIYFDILNYFPLCQEIEFVGMSMRLNQVEEIISPIKFKYNLCVEDISKNIPTIGYNMYFNLKVQTEKEVDIFINEYMEEIVTQSSLYFNRNENISIINIDMKNTIIQGNDVISNGLNSIARSLILLKLCNDIDYDIMKIKYRELLKPFDGQEERTFAAYDELVSYLSKMEQ
jgi:hypothetical protein